MATTIWKLSIKTSKRKGYEPFAFCRDNGLIGIGWHDAFHLEDGGHRLPQDTEEAFRWMREEWEGEPLHVVHRFLFEVKPGDLVWIHQAGGYWLCRVEDGLIFGRDISPDYVGLDLGSARKAHWVKVEPALISGTVLRGCIAPITMQRINLSDSSNEELEKRAYEVLHHMKAENPAWQPELSDARLLEWLAPENTSLLLRALTPEDHEDLIAYYLQEQGWLLRKSSCFRSHAAFEFQMHHRDDGRVGYVQVKTGRTTLDACVCRSAAPTGEVLLHAPAGVYNLDAVSGVKVIAMDEVLAWVREHHRLIGPHVRARLALLDECGVTCLERIAS